MAQSFVLAPVSRKGAMERPRRVLVTGAAGNIGSYFAEHSYDRYSLRLMVRAGDENAEAIKPYGEIITGELGDLDFLKSVCAGMDAVVHLAGNPGPSAVWSDILQDNMAGTYHLFVAAKAAGCRRVVYASSIHAVSGYPPDVQVKTSDPVNPGDLYGVSKCFGEALARYMALQEGLPTIAIRIGAFQPLEAAREEDGLRMLNAFVSHRDLNQLLQRCVEADHIQFAIFNGLSNNVFKRLDISDARELVGYAPQDDLAQLHPRLHDLDLDETISTNSIADNYPSGLRKELES